MKGAGFIPALVLFLVFYIYFSFITLPKDLFPDDYSNIITDRSGELLSAGIAPDGQWRFPGKGALPGKFIQAVTTYEDKRFFTHPGIDILAMARAFRSNLSAGKIVSGASTLTMQVIRLHRQGRPRLYSEKLIEMLMAIRLTIEVDKNQVLDLFASHAPFGGNVVGIEAASWRYFGRAPENMGWADAALLAVLPNTPALIHPGRNRNELLNKRNRLLIRLYEKQSMTREDLNLAMAEPIPPNPLPLPRHAPHLLERIKSGSIPIPDSIDTRDAVRTTINGDLQRRLNALTARYSMQLKNQGVSNLGLIVMETKSGEVLAYIGNGPLETTPAAYVDMIKAPRSTGSLLKPFLYAGMMDAGELLPRQLVLDIPTRMGAYMPENPTHIYLGAVRADDALAQSLNVPAARLLKEFGIDRFYGLLEELGMNTLIRSADGYGVGMVLGGAEGSLENLTGIYSGLGRTVLLDKTEAVFFSPRYFPNQEPENIKDSPLKAGSCRLVLKAMEELVRPEEEAGWRNFISSRDISWKTGTSYGFRDAWAIGVTPGYTLGVWIGNADGEGNTAIQGTRAAAPLLFQAIELLDNTGSFPYPENMIELTTCRTSGFLAGPYCPQTDLILFPPVPNPGKVCPYHKIVNLDPTGTMQVTTREEASQKIIQETWFVLPAVAEWYYSRWNINYRPLPPHKNSKAGVDNDPMALPFPASNDEFYVPVDLNGNPGAVVFEIFHRESESTVFWHIDEEYMGSTTGIHQLEARPEKGPHTLTIIDEKGAVLQRHFNVLSN